VRIIQVVPSLAAGGLERVATTLALRLAGTGDDVVVATSTEHTHQALERELRDAGLRVARIPRPRPRPVRLLRSALALAALIRREHPDLLHAHNPAAGAVAALARRLARRSDLPVVVTFHGLVDGGEGRAARLLRAAADVVVGVSPAATAELVRAGLPQARTATVLNGVDAVAAPPRSEIRARLDVSDDAELVVTVGRYREEKNQELLLEAAALLAPERPRLRVLLAGVGPLEEQLRARIGELDLGEVATLTGHREDAAEIVAAADVATLTSNREALGLTLLEAMAAGTAVVGTAVGGIPEVVEDRVNGLLVPPRDAKALAAAIALLLDDASLRARLVEQGRSTVANRFSTAAMTSAYREVYERALRSRSARRRTGASPSK
jgi:glycosyltransferase involved in cell wall biosynthesis